MAAKKKSTKKPKKANKTVRKKTTPTKAKKRSKKVTRKNPAPKKVPKKRAKKKAPKKKAAAKKQPRKKSTPVDELAFSSEGRVSSMDEQSGDLQGLSRRESADSESVDELIEEGNAFEADVVAGVESADDADEKEVHTHEVPEDDVPGEYLDED
jgi:hypothetical protein